MKNLQITKRKHIERLDQALHAAHFPLKCSCGTEYHDLLDFILRTEPSSKPPIYIKETKDFWVYSRACKCQTHQSVLMAPNSKHTREVLNDLSTYLEGYSHARAVSFETAVEDFVRDYEEYLVINKQFALADSQEEVKPLPKRHERYHRKH